MKRTKAAATLHERADYHPYLSANSVRLSQADQFALSFKGKIVLLSAVLLMLLTAGAWLVVTRYASPLALMTVKERDFSFSVQYFKQAAILTSHKTNYLVAHDKQGKETTLWVAKMKSPLSCGASRGFGYTVPAGVTLHSGCYEADRLTFAADITVDHQVYQINMTSQKPISVRDAKAIMSSISIQR